MIWSRMSMHIKVPGGKTHSVCSAWGVYYWEYLVEGHSSRKKCLHISGHFLFKVMKHWIQRIEMMDRNNYGNVEPEAKEKDLQN